MKIGQLLCITGFTRGKMLRSEGHNMKSVVKS